MTAQFLKDIDQSGFFARQRSFISSSFASAQKFLSEKSEAVQTAGNIFEAVGTLGAGFFPQFILPGSILTGTGKALQRFGKASMSRRRFSNFRQPRNRNPFGIRTPRRRSKRNLTNLRRAKNNNLIRIETLERKLRELPVAEVKEFDIITEAFDVKQMATGVPAVKLSAIPSGFDQGERIGERINAHALLWSIHIRHQPLSGSMLNTELVRLVIFVDSEALDSAFTTTTTLFQDTTTGNNISFYNDKFPRRFLILIDKTYTLKFHEEADAITDGGKLDLRGLTIQYTGPLTAQTGKNTIFAFILTKDTHLALADTFGKVTFNTRLQFTG